MSAALRRTSVSCSLDARNSFVPIDAVEPILPRKMKTGRNARLSPVELEKEIVRNAQREFRVLNKKTRPKRCMFRVATSFPACMKNRYGDVLANDGSRVELSDGGYVNANYISFEGPPGLQDELPAFIACQAPLRSTFGDFWRMVYEQRAPCIVMLTEFKEGSKLKADRYWPEKGCTVRFSEFAVSTLKHHTPVEGLVVTAITLQREDDAPRTVYHLHYTSWKDNSVPDSSECLCTLVTYARLFREKGAQEQALRGPMLSHCSAGIGRTGCFIALSVSLRLVELGHRPDILAIVAKMREKRSGMVQTNQQYVLLYSVVNDYMQVCASAATAAGKDKDMVQRSISVSCLKKLRMSGGGGRNEEFT